MNKLEHPLWNYGLQRKVSEAAGINAVHFREIVHRRRRAGPEAAKKISAAIASILGVLVPPGEFVMSKESSNPVFYGPVEEDFLS